MIAITATIVGKNHNQPGMRQVPTFFLDERVQGIVSELHAEQIAREIVDPFNDYVVHVAAVRL